MRLIDAKQQRLELQRMRQRLRSELFERCELQWYSDSVDLDRLAMLVFDLKANVGWNDAQCLILEIEYAVFRAGSTSARSKCNYRLGWLSIGGARQSI